MSKLTRPHCRSSAEAGRYLEVFKSFERKPPDLIRAPVDNDYMSHLTSALTSIKSVNKTDVATLSSSLGVRTCLSPPPEDAGCADNFPPFQPFSKIVTASSSTLNSLPGLGDKKVKRIRDAFDATFLVRAAPKKKVQKAGDIRASMARARSSSAAAEPGPMQTGVIRGAGA